jgi:hypothetical protein
MASTRDRALDLLLACGPLLRAARWSLPDRLLPRTKGFAWALAVDQSGLAVRDLRS